MFDRWLRFIFPVLLLVIPLSVDINFGNHQINIPSEPVMILVALLLVLKITQSKDWQPSFLKHPIVLASVIFLSWMLITVPFSTDIVTSIKYTFIELLHWWVFFVGAFIYRDLRVDRRLDWFFLSAAPIVILVPHAFRTFQRYDFRSDATVLLGQPFYSDHGLFSAVLAVLFCYLLIQTYHQYRSKSTHKSARIYPLVLTILCAIGLVLLQSRGAWISLTLAGLLALFILVFRRWWILIIALIMFALVTMITIKPFHPDVADQGGNWSLVDIGSDVATAERINRYKCAWRMFRDRPWMGFGPGTFPKAYLPYQKPEEMTRISVTSTHRPDGRVHQEGRGGGVHSEYLQTLTECGLPGLISWLILVGTFFFVVKRMLAEKSTIKRRTEIFGIGLGLATYVIHALVNNYLHQEELAVLFWGGLGLLVSTDLSQKDPDGR